MAHAPAPHQIDPEDLARAQVMWAKFVEMSKYGIIGTIAILVMLALFFL